MKKQFIGALLVSVLLIGGSVWFFVFNKQLTAPDVPQSNTQDTAQEEPKESEEPQTPEPTPTYDIATPSSLTVVVNKSRALPTDYVPADLITPDVRLRLGAGAEQMQFRSVAASALKNMFSAAAEDGVTLVFGSGYRSYALQKQFYDSYVARDGQAAADRYSARPGTSEHQTGLSFDATNTSQTCHLEICFENQPEGQWLAKNAHRFGFTLRYRDGKESITGYQYEPWHFRFIGTELAQELHKKDLTLEEYFKL